MIFLHGWRARSASCSWCYPCRHRPVCQNCSKTGTILVDSWFLLYFTMVRKKWSRCIPWMQISEKHQFDGSEEDWNRAFQSCGALSDVEFGDRLETVVIYAFGECGSWRVSKFHMLELFTYLHLLIVCSWAMWNLVATWKELISNLSTTVSAFNALPSHWRRIYFPSKPTLCSNCWSCGDWGDAQNYLISAPGGVEKWNISRNR